MSTCNRVELVELKGRRERFWAPCRIRRSNKARRVSAKVLAGGEIELVLPLRLSEKKGFAFLREQSAWLEKHIARSVAPVSLLKHLQDKPLLTIDGMPRKTEIVFVKSRAAPSWQRSTEGGVLFKLNPTGSDPESQMLSLSRKLAKTYLPIRLARLGDRIGLKPKAIRVGDQRERWGSCSSRSVLSLNWRLLLLDPPLQDYVLYHELAHLKILNHSEQYWRFLAKLDPKTVLHDSQLSKVSKILMNVGRLPKS